MDPNTCAQIHLTSSYFRSIVSILLPVDQWTGTDVIFVMSTFRRGHFIVGIRLTTTVDPRVSEQYVTRANLQGLEEQTVLSSTEWRSSDSLFTAARNSSARDLSDITIKLLFHPRCWTLLMSSCATIRVLFPRLAFPISVNITVQEVLQTGRSKSGLYWGIFSLNLVGTITKTCISPGRASYLRHCEILLALLFPPSRLRYHSSFLSAQKLIRPARSSWSIL